MNIQPVNQQMPQTNFKAVYPVRHCIQYGKSVYPINYDMKTLRNLQSTLISMLNKKHGTLERCLNEINSKIWRGKKLSLKEIRDKQKLESAIMIRNIVGEKECSHRGAKTFSKEDLNRSVRSYYNLVNGDPIKGSWTIFNISGKRDIADFEEWYAKDMGRKNREARLFNDELHNKMLKDAKDTYLREAYTNFINNPEKRLRASDGTSCYLNVVWAPITNKNGKIIKKGSGYVDYYPVSAEFRSTGKMHP